MVTATSFEGIAVAMEATFRDLSAALPHLHDALNELQVTAGDKPPDDESAQADRMETAVPDLTKTLHEARKADLNSREAESTANILP